MNINELMNDHLEIMNNVMNQTGALYVHAQTWKNTYGSRDYTSALPLAI